MPVTALGTAVSVLGVNHEAQGRGHVPEPPHCLHPFLLFLSWNGFEFGFQTINKNGAEVKDYE